MSDNQKNNEQDNTQQIDQDIKLNDTSRDVKNVNGEHIDVDNVGENNFKEEVNNDHLTDMSNDQQHLNVINNKDLSKQYQWDYEKYSKMNQFSKEKSHKNRGAIIFGSILGSLVLVFAIAYGGIRFSNWMSGLVYNEKPVDIIGNDSKGNISETHFPAVNQNKSGNNASGWSATSIAEKVIPSVVSVVPYARVQSFYQTSVAEMGYASGIIMSSDGYIITNAHVVLQLPSAELVDAVKVILNDGNEYEAQIVGVDINTDLAVLKIDAKNLSVAEFGDSDQLKVGEQVFAIGNPVDSEFAGSMTSGIVSALNRSIKLSDQLGNDNKYIQTDAHINPGNSGGPLVNNRGQIIGINERKVVNVGVEGMGFAIPINSSKPIIDDLIKYGCVKGRALLGIRIIREIDELTAKLNDVKTGVMIESVSNPDLDGLKPYDILHEFNGKKIMTFRELKDELNKCKPGDKVNLVIYRYDVYGKNEEKINVDVNLIEDQGLIKK